MTDALKIPRSYTLHTWSYVNIQFLQAWNKKIRKIPPDKLIYATITDTATHSYENMQLSRKTYNSPEISLF